VRDVSVAHWLCGTVTIAVADPIAPPVACALIVIVYLRPSRSSPLRDAGS
jgi:hypothetical protein